MRERAEGGRGEREKERKRFKFVIHEYYNGDMIWIVAELQPDYYWSTKLQSLSDWSK